MSNIVHIKQQDIANNLVKAAELKSNTLSLPEVQGGLSEIEYKTAEATTRKPIKALSDDDLQKEIAATLKFIIKDLGIHNFSGQDAGYQTIRFMKLLREYYGEMSYREVELAFEMSMTGQLANYLEDRNHYQQFSVDYITKVLNAFRAYKQKVWVKANSLVPSKNLVSEEEKERSKRFNIDDLIAKFREYREKKVTPNFMVPAIPYEILKKSGLTKNDLTASPEDKARAFNILIMRCFTSEERIKLKEDYENDVNNKKLEIHTQRESIKSEIISIFDDVILLGQDIEELLIID